MKPGSSLLYIVILLLLPVATVPNNLKQITSREGLSNSSVYCLFQDSRRFLWIGTFDGLNMYDGRNIEVYKPDINNTFSLSSNVIRSILETGDGYLWISTKWGLNKFSLKENIIVGYYSQFKEDSHIAKDSRDNFYILGRDGYISMYDESRKTFIDLPVNSKISNKSISGLFIDSDDVIWINHCGTLERYTVSLNERQMPTILRQGDFPHHKSVKFATCDHGRILFIDDNNDLYRTESGKTWRIRNIDSLVKDNGEISAVIYDGGDILIGFKTNGLVYLRAQEEFKAERADINCGVFSLLKDDAQDIVWIGTDGQGAYAQTKDEYSFRNVPLTRLPVKKQRPVRAIYSDSRGYLWIGTKDNGVIRMKNHTQKEYSTGDVTHYTTRNGLSNDGVFAFTYSNLHNALWIASYGPDLNYYSYGDNKIHTLRNDTPDKTYNVHAILEGSDSILWVGSGSSLLKMKVVGQGDRLYAKQTRRIDFDLKYNQTYNQIYSLVQQNDSILWIGIRGNGVVRFNTQTEDRRLISFDKNGIAPMNDVLCVHQDKNNTLWLGTSYGLTRLDVSRDGQYEFKNYNRNDGLPNNTIHGILGTPEGKLWLSSNTGIILFDPASESFRNFNHKNGLNTTEFSDNAYFRDEQNNTFFFGGVDGVVWIKKEEVEQKDFIPELFFTKIRIFNEEYPIDKFQKHRRGKEYVELKNSNNSFSFTFIAMDFLNGENGRYSYRLKNFSDVWLNTYSNEANFTNIAPGSYTLQVRYDDGTSVEDRIAEIRVVVLPPWYFTTTARIAYFLLLLAGAYGAYRYMQRRYDKRKKESDRLMEERYKEEMYESKLRFFTNITHEFSTPLTLIYGPCERILDNDQTKPWVKKYAQIIKSNAERLNTLIQEIIDFRRMETGNKTSCIREVDLSETICGIADSFEGLVEQNGINFHLDVEPDLRWNTDQNFFTKIATNLISNAFKYTPGNGTISVTLRKENGELVLKVYNTGKGIRESSIPLVFNRYSILDNVEENSIKGLSSRNGLGLAICHSLTELLHGTIRIRSEVNQYAEFIVTLPPLEADDSPVTDAAENQFCTPAPSSDIPDGGQPPVPDKNARQARVLVIDDNKDLLWLLKDILSKEYDVHTAENGRQGLDALKKALPDLVITDVMMPEVDGITLARRIRENKHTSHIPLIILSAKVSNEEKIEGIESGADVYIPKPFNTEYLRAVVGRLIDRKRNLEDYYNTPASAFKYSDGKLLPGEDCDFIQSAVETINTNIDNPDFSAEDLAGAMQTSVRNLYRRFKSLDQPTPNELINDLRFSLAAKLLVTTSLTVQEIIYKTGFNNRAHFNREFAKRYHSTPVEYRKKNKLPMN